LASNSIPTIELWRGPSSVVRYRREPRAVKTELIGHPTVVSNAVEVKVRLERDGKSRDFVVTMHAPGLWQYNPPVADVRWAIERVLAEHHTELREKFAEIWTTTHAVPPGRPSK
jgi:hypothetical protein